MTRVSSRRSFLRYSGIGLTGLIAGCQTPAQQTSVPILIDNRDATNHDVQIEITGTEKAFNTQVSVDGGALVKVTDVASDDFCLRVDVLELDEGVLEDCPSAGDSDYSASGTAVIITSEPNERGQQWVIEPIQNVSMDDNQVTRLQIISSTVFCLNPLAKKDVVLDTVLQAQSREAIVLNSTPITTGGDQQLKAPVTLESRASLSFERAELSRDDERRFASFEPRSSRVAVLASSGFLERTSPFRSHPS